MTELDADAGRDFQGLDARESQEALAEELTSDPKETVSVTEKKKPKTKKQKKDASAPASAAASAPASAIEWSEEDLAAHVRMAEALLFAAAEPLDEESIADRLPAGANIAQIIERLASHYQDRGVNLAKVENKWRFLTAADVAYVLEKEKVTPRRLSRAALETLAIIAYHQPCTRADIEDVRGVQVAKGSLDQLLEIGWVRLRGKRRDVPGRPILYGTTQVFLEHFGLESVSDLPGVADLKAAGLLDARLPPGFSVPSPVDGGEVEIDDDGEEIEFAQDFLEEENEETADA